MGETNEFNGRMPKRWGRQPSSRSNQSRGRTRKVGEVRQQDPSEFDREGLTAVCDSDSTTARLSPVSATVRSVMLAILSKLTSPADWIGAGCSLRSGLPGRVSSTSLILGSTGDVRQVGLETRSVNQSFRVGGLPRTVAGKPTVVSDRGERRSRWEGSELSRS